MKFLRKPTEEGVNLAAPKGQEDATLFSGMEALYEYLTCAEWEDGSLRESSTLLCFVEDGRWKVCLNDRAASRSCWASGDSLLGALASLDAALASGAPEWRRSEGRRRK